MNISQTLQSRYTTKAYDPSKKISDEDFAKLKEVMRMSPSSTNLQPWHFIIADDDAGKTRIAKGTEGFYSFNEAKVTQASHVVVFASKVFSDDAHFDLVTEQEDKDGRYPSAEIKTQVDGIRKLFCNIHRFDLRDEAQWHANQVYLNMGAVLLACAQLGIDAIPMEGIDLKAINEEFGLNEKGYTALAVVSFGYRSKEDFNDPAKTPKSRLPDKVIFTKA